MFALLNPVKSPDLTGYFVESHPCPSCGYSTTAFVTPFQMFSYHRGAMAQDVLADYDADTRERFISGYCGDCWNAMFSFDDEDY